MTARGIRLLALTIAFLALAISPSLAAAASPNVRIVRLSLAQGDVQVNRNIAGNQGQGWEQAIDNMPLTEGMLLYAAEDSKAELEFEDGSSVRLIGPAQISLKQLSFAPNGSPATQIEVDSGLVYVNASLNDHEDFRIESPDGEAFAITRPTHLRFNVEEQVALLSVMDGEVEALDGASNAKIHGGESYNYILGQPESAARVGNVPPDNEDAWNQQRNQYNDQYAATGAQYSEYENSEAYGGQADLDYYGAYQDIPGYGESWQPYDVGPDWDPFDYGAWCDYPDWGWTFVSAYPWGWYPFYYGDWFYVSGRGWWWHPGPRHGPGGHDGFHPQPVLASAPHGFSAPHPPPGSSHRTVAIAGSNLRVGPIGVTHASMTQEGTAFDNAIRPRTSGAASPTSAVTPSAARSGASSNFVHGENAASGSLIGGQRGAYYVTRSTPGRVPYDVNRPDESSGGELRSAPRATAYSGVSPRAYSYGGSYAPRAYSAPPISSAPHFSGVSGFHGGGGGFSSGGGFHGGGSVGGGGFHGGGGRR